MNKLCAKIYKECLFMLTGAFLLILLGLAVIIPPLKHNKFYLLNIGLVVIASYFFENNVFKNYYQYAIWFREYGNGSYLIKNNFLDMMGKKRDCVLCIE